MAFRWQRYQLRENRDIGERSAIVAIEHRSEKHLQPVRDRARSEEAPRRLTEASRDAARLTCKQCIVNDFADLLRFSDRRSLYQRAKVGVQEWRAVNGLPRDNGEADALG